MELSDIIFRTLITLLGQSRERNNLFLGKCDSSKWESPN